MDWVSLGAFTVLILVTAAIYSAFPVLFAWLRKSEIDRKTYRAWCVTITVLIAIIFSVFDSLWGEEIRFAPAVLWGTIFYNTGIKILRRRKLLTENSDSKVEVPAIPEPEPEESAELFEGQPVKTIVHVHKVSSKTPTPKQESPKAPVPTNSEIKKKNHISIITLVLGLALVVSCVFSAYQTFRVYKLGQQLAQTKSDLVTSEKTAENCKEKLTALRKKLQVANEKANFLDNNIAFVTEAGKTYHTYDCQVFKNADRFWAYNTEAAEARGYKPCKLCHP